ncbi:MAG TPA: zinc ribbon domain-containing protein [Blastocatellia bacterium]|nr:zinc ribbon domain-containing protein [Blastocatellia bacterium]
MYCEVCERESQSSSVHCESCGYPLAGAAPEESIGRAAEWSYTSPPTMEGRCHSCGREIEADRSFCRACETEINAAAEDDCRAQSETTSSSEWENYGADGIPVELTQQAPDPAGPKFSRRTAATLILLPVAITLLWLGVRSDWKFQPESSDATRETPLARASSSQAQPSPLRQKSVDNSLTIRPAASPVISAAGPSETNRGQASTQSPPPVKASRRVTQPEVHLKPRRELPADRPSVAQRNGRPQAARGNWSVRVVKGIGKKVAWLFR